MQRDSKRRRLAVDSAVYAGGLALQRGLAVVVLPAATRVLAPSEVGAASAALAAAGLLSMVFTLGCNFAVVRLFYDEPADAARTHWALLLRVQALLAVALAAVAWLLGPLWSGVFDDVSWGGALQAAVVLAVAQAAQATALGVLRAARRVAAFAAVVATQVVSGGVLAIVLADRNGPGGFVAGLAIGAAAGAVLATALTWRRPVWSWPALRAGLALSIPFVAHLVAGWTLGLSDRILIERFLDLDDLASYHLAYALASVPILLTDAVQSAWVPDFYGSDSPAKRELPGRLARPATVVVTAFAGLVVLVAPAAGRLLAPSEFDIPVVVVALVVAVTFVRVPYLLAFSVVSDVKESTSIARASSLAAVLNVGLNLWVIPLWGLNGAAATTLFAYAVMSAVLVRRAEAVGAASMGLPALVRMWVVGAAIMLGLAALPTGPAGWALRGVLAVPVLAAGVAGFRRARAAYA